MSAPRVLLVLTSHDDLGGVRKTGYYVSEAAHPWQVFHDAGYRVDIASVRGGVPPQDGFDDTDPVQAAFLNDPDIAAQLAESKTVADYNPADYDPVLYVGGHGTMWDFPDDAELARFSAAVYQSGGVVSAVCHGPSGLLNIVLPDGSYLVDGKNLTGFTNSEEAAVELTDVVPFLLQTTLEQRGAIFHAGKDFTDNVVVDGRLVTGQNPQSATSVGRAVVEELSAR